MYDMYVYLLAHNKRTCKNGEKEITTVNNKNIVTWIWKDSEWQMSS